MIKQMVRDIAYMCPECAAVTGRKLNIFEFSGNKEKVMHCGVHACREKTISMSVYKDKYKISAMCPICCREHELLIGKAAFWTGKYFELRCPDTGMKLFFAGDSERIKREVKKQEQMLSEMSEEYAGQEDIPILIEMFEVIEGMNLCGEIRCECGSKRVATDMADGKVILLCLKCGATMKITPSEKELDKILDEGIVIKKQV